MRVSLISINHGKIIEATNLRWIKRAATVGKKWAKSG